MNTDTCNFELAEKELTRRILGACMEVSNTLGAGFAESVYHNALIRELGIQGLQAQSQCGLEVHYKAHPVGSFVADLLVEGRVIVELKALSSLGPEHGAQLLNYLKGMGIRVGLLVNFGTPRLQWKRLVL